MKTWTLRFRTQDKDNFDDLKSGLKSIETRAATAKYKPVAKGDVLTFVCGKERISKKVSKIHHWHSVDEMVEDVGIKVVMPDIESIDQMKARYVSYPGYEEKIKKEGILGFEIADL